MNSSAYRGDDVESTVNEENDNNSNGESQQTNQKCYRRHTLHQIQRMEACFRDCPHLDKKQRIELSEELGMEPLQVKFWFQNKRTQMKAKHEHQENTFLRAENEKLREENSKLREALSNASCHACGHVVAVGGVSLDECYLRKENTRLREDIARVSAIAVKYIGRPLTKSVATLSPSSSSSVGCSTGFEKVYHFQRNNDKQGK